MLLRFSEIVLLDAKVFVFNQCLCQVEPLGRLGESLFNLAVKNRNFSAHEISSHFLLESDFRLILFEDD